MSNPREPVILHYKDSAGRGGSLSRFGNIAATCFVLVGAIPGYVARLATGVALPLLHREARLLALLRVVPHGTTVATLDVSRISKWRWLSPPSRSEAGGGAWAPAPTVDYQHELLSLGGS